MGWVHWRLLLPGRSEWRLRKREIHVRVKPIAALLPTTVPILVPYASPLKCRGTNEQKQSSRDSHYTPVLPFASGSPLPLLHPWVAHLPVHSLHFGVSSSWCLGLGCLVCVFPEWPALSPLGAVTQMWLSLRSVSQLSLFRSLVIYIAHLNNFSAVPHWNQIPESLPLLNSAALPGSPALHRELTLLSTLVPETIPDSARKLYISGPAHLFWHSGTHKQPLLLCWIIGLSSDL